MKIGQPALDVINRADRENRERLIRNIVNPTDGLTVQIRLQDLPEPNFAPPLQLPSNVNAIVDELIMC